jgi:hypothetical protein
MVTAAEIRTRTRLQLARLPLLQRQPVPVTDGATRQQQLEQDLSRLDSEINVEQQRLADLVQRLEEERADPASTSASRGAIDDQIGEQRRLLTQLGRARTNIQEGFTFESSVSRATQAAVAETKRIELFRQAQREGVLTPAQVRSFQREEFARLQARRGIIVAGPPVPVRPEVPVIPPAVVRDAPTFTEQFLREIEEKKPELKFVPESDIKTGIQTILGIGLGTLSFSKAKVQGQISQLRDIEGKRIFTPEQAKGLTDVGFEVAEGFALGAGTGKAFTLGRGAFLKTLSPAIKNSPKFKTITKVADVTLLAGLGAVEARRLNQVAKTQGADQAIIEAIGLVSFGVGFTKTGLKADPVAEKEFDKFVSTFRDIGAKGRRGELLPRRRRRRKRGDIQVLEQLTKEDVEKAEAIISEVEKRLLRQKDLKGQLKVLAELKKGLKTPEAKKNFQEFVLSLIEKDILKVPRIEIRPGVEIRPAFREMPPFEVVAFREVPKGSILNQQRVAKARLKTEVSIKVAGIQRDIEKQRSKILSLVSQKAPQKVIQTERLKLEKLQKERLKLRTQFVQVSKLKLKEVLRLRPGVPRPKPRRPPRIFIPPPFPGLKKPIPKKKLVKVPLAEGGYNVFVKSKGKFKKVNINPLSKKKAHDLGSWLVDRSTSRTWKRKQVGFKAQKPILKVPSDYFKKTIKKYRGKKIKGKVQPLINLGIEKRKFAIDTPREKKQLSVARVRAELLRKLGLKKPRRRPTGLRATKLIKFKRR